MRFILVFCLVFQLLNLNGQTNIDRKRDHNWIYGYGDVYTYWHGCGINFNNDTLSTFLLNSNKQFIMGFSTSISDTSGVLFCYSNGMHVSDKNGNIMPHGDSLGFGPGYINQTMKCNGATAGPFCPSGGLLLPLPSNDNIYSLFYIVYGGDYLYQETRPIGLSYSLISSLENNGLGDVIQKDIPIINAPVCFGGISANRHANGRDWWILVPAFNENAFYRILLDPEGPHLIGKQYIGLYNHRFTAISTFSPDGNSYAIANKHGSYDTLNMSYFSFDRLTGLMDNYVDLSFSDTICWIMGLSFSPSSRFLYFPNCFKVYQWDLLTNDIPSSRQVVANWDGYHVGPQKIGFTSSQLAPDGKIYINGMWNFLHVIEHPDEPGSSCNVVQRAITLPHPIHFNTTYFPNFRLGATLGLAEEEKLKPCWKLTAAPNPANSNLRFEFQATNFTNPMELEIINSLGIPMSSHYIAPFQQILDLDISNFSNGIYFGNLKNRKGTVLNSIKFIKSR